MRRSCRAQHYFEGKINRTYRWIVCCVREKERNQGWSLGLSGTECCHLTSRLPSKKGTNECMAAQRVFHKRAGVCFPERARGWAGPIAEGLRGATSPAQSCRDFPERFRVKVSEPAPERLGEVQPHGTTSGLCPQLLPVPALGATMLCDKAHSLSPFMSLLRRQEQRNSKGIPLAPSLKETWP